MVDCNLFIAKKPIDDFSSKKRAPSCGQGVADISVANINRHNMTARKMQTVQDEWHEKMVVAFVMYIFVEELVFRSFTPIIICL